MKSLPPTDREPERALASSDTSAPGQELGAVPGNLSERQYAIAAVSRLSGISCHTLRVWERRYGFPVPVRSPSGHRRYDRTQVQMLCHLGQMIRVERQPVGELISLMKAGKLDVGGTAAPERGAGPDASNAELLSRLLCGDLEGAERDYNTLARQLEPPALVERLIHPLLVEAGDGWFRGSYSVFQERLVTVFLRAKLTELIQAARSRNLNPVHRAIVGTVQGDRHEGGALILCHALELRGWRVYNLGVDLPVSEYRIAISRLRASVLAISFVLSRNIRKRFQELRQIKEVPVFVGGRSIINYQSVARSHGLIPLAGPVARSVEQLLVEYDRWCLLHDVAR